jgi:hypothetical protein
MIADGDDPVADPRPRAVAPPDVGKLEPDLSNAKSDVGSRPTIVRPDIFRLVRVTVTLSTVPVPPGSLIRWFW